MKADKTWILIGMMGAGKTSVGQHLAELAGRDFSDTDRMLIHRLGRPIPQLFSIYGEEAFRSHETAILRSLEPGPYVLATGGGVITRPENWVELRRLGITVFLDFPDEVLQERLSTSKKRRPLLMRDDWVEAMKSIYETRRPIYEQADLHVRPKGTNIEATAQFVLEEIQKYTHD